jgi:hypothetical protein
MRAWMRKPQRRKWMRDEEDEEGDLLKDVDSVMADDRRGNCQQCGKCCALVRRNSWGKAGEVSGDHGEVF